MKENIKVCQNHECSVSHSGSKKQLEQYFESLAWI